MTTDRPSLAAPPDAAPAGVRLADMSDEQILQMIARAQTDPFAANEVMHLQKQAFDSINKAIQAMIGTLAEIDPAAPMQNVQMSVAALASAGREREAAARQKREFAQNLIIGALLNQDNPDWDIFDESAQPPATADRNGILALLQMAPPAAFSRPPATE